VPPVPRAHPSSSTAAFHGDGPSVDTLAPETDQPNSSPRKAAKSLASVATWRVDPGTAVELDKIGAGSTPEAPGDRATTEKASAELMVRLAALQNRLRAEEQRSVLLVLQAMDAGGKDGTVKSVFSGVNPMGMQVSSFNVPNDDELAHDFLWRIHQRTPTRGFIGIFNRSHYEDVLAVRVRKLAPEKVWRQRYGLINHFERSLSEAGTSVVKVMLHISLEEQARRLQERINDPTKRWKFRLGDLEDRKLWPDYQRAYEDALTETSTEHAPWFVVPANRKWYRNWAVLTILVDALERIDPKFPERPDLAGVRV